MNAPILKTANPPVISDSILTPYMKSFGKNNLTSTQEINMVANSPTYTLSNTVNII